MSSERTGGVLTHMQVLIRLIPSSSQALRENAVQFDLKGKGNRKTTVKGEVRQSRPPRRFLGEPVWNSRACHKGSCSMNSLNV